MSANAPQSAATQPGAPQSVPTTPAPAPGNGTPPRRPSPPPNGAVRPPGPVPPTAAAAPAPRKDFAISRGVVRRAHRIGIYGPGGVGKTTLASTIEQVTQKPVAFIDLDNGSEHLDVARISNISAWQELRGALHAPMWDNIGTIVIDTATKAEELAVQHTLAHVMNDKGKQVSSVEGYGFGKGLQHVYETFLPIYADMDMHIRAGRNVVLICHECIATVPNPNGDDYIRYEPRLQSPTSGKASIRHRLKEWLDHLLFVGYDVATNDAGKGIGAGTRRIYSTEMPTHWAKNRDLGGTEFSFEPGELTLWQTMFASK